MSGMGVMGGLLVTVSLVVLGRLAMMACRVLVMIGRCLVVLDDLVLGHDSLHPVIAPTMIGGTHQDSRKAMLQPRDRRHLS